MAKYISGISFERVTVEILGPISPNSKWKQKPDGSIGLFFKVAWSSTNTEAGGSHSSGSF